MVSYSYSPEWTLSSAWQAQEWSQGHNWEPNHVGWNDCEKFWRYSGDKENKGRKCICHTNVGCLTWQDQWTIKDDTEGN